jgi:lambda family phage portal protein
MTAFIDEHREMYWVEPIFRTLPFAPPNHLRAVAAGMGLTCELVSGDLEGVTYFAIRAGPIDFRRRIEQVQHNVVVHLFFRPVWERSVRLAVLSGDLPARDLDRDPAAHLACEWLPHKFDYVDPKKAVGAEILAINAGLKSRTQAISERGYDAEHVDAEIAADKARSDALGIKFSAPARARADPAWQ